KAGKGDFAAVKIWVRYDGSPAILRIRFHGIGIPAIALWTVTHAVRRLLKRSGPDIEMLIGEMVVDLAFEQLAVAKKVVAVAMERSKQRV
ncbi:hypothetical protein SARC_16748, partial [Sphaeroforma arctica JP610]